MSLDKDLLYFLNLSKKSKFSLSVIKLEIEREDIRNFFVSCYSKLTRDHIVKRPFYSEDILRYTQDLLDSDKFVSYPQAEELIKEKFRRKSVPSIKELREWRGYKKVAGKKPNLTVIGGPGLADFFEEHCGVFNGYKKYPVFLLVLII